MKNAENIADSWDNIIAKKKFYHNIRISGTQKKQKVFKEFAKVICDKWEKAINYAREHDILTIVI